MDSLEQPLDRDSFSVGSLDEARDRNYWRNRSPEDRLAALEFLRQVMYGYDPASDRIQKVLEVIELGER